MPNISRSKANRKYATRYRRVRKNSESQFLAPFRVMARRKLDTLAWLSRILTIIYVPLSILTESGPSRVSSYYRVLWLNTFTSTIRLYQQFPSNVRFDLFILIRVVDADASHYLFHSFLFISHCPPIQMTLLPILIFALLHFSTFSFTLLAPISKEEEDPSSKLLTPFVFFTSRADFFLTLAAELEIMLMPVVCFYTYYDPEVLCMTPIMYLRFLSLRFCSRRNPYVREFFLNIRKFFQRMAMSQKCPGFLTKVISIFIWITMGVAADIPQSPPITTFSADTFSSVYNKLVLAYIP